MTAYKHNTFQIRLRCALRPVFCALLLIVVIVGSLFASFELQAFESRFFGSKDYQGQQPDSSHTMIKNQTVKSELMLLGSILLSQVRLRRAWVVKQVC